jgi:hypothetical protein
METLPYMTPAFDWRVNLSEEKPEIICIFGGSFLNQLILKDISKICDMPDSFVNTTHHDEHWHHGGSQIQGNETALHFFTGELKEEYIFTFPGLEKFKFREEKNGVLIGKGSAAYFLNNMGFNFLKNFRNKVTVSDVKEICKQFNVPEEAGLEFIKRLVLFGILR